MRRVACLLPVLMVAFASAADESPFPKAYLQDQEFFEGHWIGEGHIGDQPAWIEFRQQRNQ